MLSQENIDALVDGGALRSLKIHETMPPMLPATHFIHNCDYLDAFTSLAHLSITLSHPNCASLVSALSRLAQLRALEFTAPDDASRVIE